MQNTVPVLPDDTEDTLSDRLLPIEHKTYKEALRLFCEDKLTIKGRVVYIEDWCVSKGRRYMIKNALLSVSDKTGIVDFAKGLVELGVTIYSTGGNP